MLSPPASPAARRTGSRRRLRRRRRVRRDRSRGRSRAPGRGRSGRGRRPRGRPAGRAGRRGDGPGRVDRGGCRRVGHERAGLKERVQGEDGRGPRLRSPDGRTDTGMPVAIRRAIAHGSDRAERRGQQSARSDRSFSEALDVISVSPVPYGPFGQDQRYGGRSGRVNGFVHELRRGMRQSIHELSTVVDGAWTGRWITGEDVDGDAGPTWPPPGRRWSRARRELFLIEQPDAPGPAGLGYLATVRADGGPRVHPVSPAVLDGRLYVYVLLYRPSSRDLQGDGRYALHSWPKPFADDGFDDEEFYLTGRADPGRARRSSTTGSARRSATGRNPGRRSSSTSSGRMHKGRDRRSRLHGLAPRRPLTRTAGPSGERTLEGGAVGRDAVRRQHELDR